MTTTYTATPEMCHPSVDYGEHLLPHDWPGKKFRLRDDDRCVTLEAEEAASSHTWVITRELAAKIKASVDTDPTTEVTPETGPTAIVSLEKYEDEIKTKNATIEQQLEELRRLRDVVTTTEEELRNFKRRVGEIAMEYAQRHDWCSTVEEALDEMGIEVPTKDYVFTLSVIYRVRGTKESYGDPDTYDIQRNAYLEPDVTMTMDDWGDLEVEYVQHDVMDIEEVTE